MGDEQNPLHGFPMNDPYFHAKKVREHFEISGVCSNFSGHEIKQSDGGKCDGVFAGWSWEKDRLEVRNDRYGFFPLYYFAREGEIGVSTSILRLVALGAPTELDSAALAVFLRLGTFVGEDTPFSAIRAVPPDTTFEWKDGKLRVSGRLALGKLDRMKRSAAIDSYIQLFKAAIRRRLPPSKDFAVPLSGGRDSRHILLELCEAGLRPQFCVTQRLRRPQPTYNDAEIAPQLAEALKVEHVILDQTQSPFESTLRSILETSFCSYSHGYMFVIADYLKGKVHSIYDGIGGGVLSGGFLLDTRHLTLFESSRFNELADHLLGEEIISSVLVPRQRHRLSRELAISRLTVELRKHVEAPNPVASFIFWNRTRRHISVGPYCILNKNVQVFSPYLDHGLYDFLASLPASMFLDKAFHTDTIRRAYPRYAEIPYSVMQDGQFDNRHYFRKFALERAWYCLGNSRSRLVDRWFFMPRLVRCLLDKRYSASITWLGPLALYLLRLETVSEEGRI